MGEPSIINFRNLWKKNVSNLENNCETWQSKFDSCTIPDDVQGQIRTTIGLAKLLIGQKLKQFNGLIDDSEFKTGEKEITLEDLQGFWDMVYSEVEKIQNGFNDLQDCQNNDWKFVEKNDAKVPQKKQVLKKAPAKKEESANSHALAAKERLAQIKKKMLAQRKKQSEEKSAENAVLEESVPTSEDNDTVKETKKSDEASHSPSKIAKTKSVRPSTKTSGDKENTPENTPTLKAKKNKKVKKYEGEKLQCLTRSAKKALLDKQNAEKKS